MRMYQIIFSSVMMNGVTLNDMFDDDDYNDDGVTIEEVGC